MTVPCHAVIDQCGLLFFTFNAADFAPSAFGLVHSERPGQHQYSHWSASTANEVLAAIALGKPINELFEIGIRARQDFARKFENIENPELDFGASRVFRSRHVVGEDMMGLSTINLDLTKGKSLPRDFANWPNLWWINIANNESRSRLADEIINKAIETSRLSKTDYNLLIIDRFYESYNGRVSKSSSTKFQRAVPDQKESPYFVSTLNTPKPEIEYIMADVQLRIRLAINATNKKLANEHLSHAMYGFFNAMPYYRGTAAIGRIIFTALFSWIRDEPVTIDPECDVKALIQNQDEYLNNLASIVHSSKGSP